MLEPSSFNRICKGKHGYFLYNKYDLYIGKSMALYGEWSEEEVALCSLICRQGDVVIEAGANIGTHTVPLAKRVGKTGRIYAFEAQRIIFQNLCANVALNSIDNVECFNIAVGAEESFVRIPELSYNSEANFGAVRANNHARGKKVPLHTLDKFLELDSLRLIKADIEGMEVDLLKGAQQLLQKFHPFLYLEADPSINGPELVEIALKMDDYLFYRHVTSLFVPNNYANNPVNGLGGDYASYNILGVPRNSPPIFDEKRFGLKLLRSPRDWLGSTTLIYLTLCLKLIDIFRLRKNRCSFWLQKHRVF